MAKHSPSIELSAARRELQAAREECPHWDLEVDFDGGTHDCCARVERAKRSVRTARKACEAQP